MKSLISAAMLIGLGLGSGCYSPDSSAQVGSDATDFGTDPDNSEFNVFEPDAESESDVESELDADAQFDADISEPDADPDTAFDAVDIGSDPNEPESDADGLDADDPDVAETDSETDSPDGDDAVCAPAITASQFDVPYLTRGEPLSDAMTLLDIYPPDGARCGLPIVVWVHGGAWSLGDKANQMEDKIPYFNGLGAVLISVNYRLTRADNGVQHPDHVEDVAAALAWIRAHAAEFGGDPGKIALLGHSAGAHLVALAATNPRFLAEYGGTRSDLACVGSYDTEYNVADIVARDAAYEAVFSTDPDLWADASPTAHVAAGLPPFQLACRGSARRVEQCEAFAQQLSAAGGQALIIDADALQHEEVNSEIGRESEVIMTPRVTEFLAVCFAD